MNKKQKRGISLIMLVITIIVVVVLAGAIILALNNSGILDQSKKARFMNDFTSVQDGVNVYSSCKYNSTTGEFDLPLKGYLTAEDKIYIKENVPTLQYKIEQLSGSIDVANLAWINSEEIGANLSSAKVEKGYIMDVATKQIYDYNGDVFENKRWHTLDSGIDISNNSNGYIKLTLFYPAGSTERKWRLGNPGELRLDASLQWQYYTSPINIPIYRIQDVWISYVLNGKSVKIPPEGTLLVDIIPDETIKKVDKVNVTIDYDKDATTKEYRVGNSRWMPYTGPFVVTENVIVAARSTKKEEVKDSKGNVILTRDITGSDKIFIGNIEIKESDLEAPTIERLDPIDASEKARVRITYPEIANLKVYKENYGLEVNYVEEISIKEWDTSILAYYCDITGKKSQGAIILINDPTLEPKKEPEKYKPIDPTDPNNPYNPSNPDNPNNPNNPFSPLNPNNPDSPLNPNNPYNPNNPGYSAKKYDPSNPDSPYNPNNPNNPYNPANPDSPLNPNNPENPMENPEDKLTVNITADPEPLADTMAVSKVVVSIDYDSRSTKNTYAINDGEIQNYTGSFEITENSTIYAYAQGDNNLEGSAIKKIDNLLLGISQPVITPNPTEEIKSAKITIDIQYDKNATIKKYSINKGELKDYAGEFEVTENGTEIYAYNENKGGEKAEVTYTVSNIDPNEPTQVEENPIERTAVLEKEKYYIMKLTYPEDSFVKDYKFTESGAWTPYKQDGIMLIKSQYKDEVLSNIQSNGVLRIKDDSGNTIDFNGDWYVINTTVSDLIESLFMRWDSSDFPGPQIAANTTMPIKEVSIALICPEGYKSRQYKVVKAGDAVPDTWQNYTESFKVDRNNSTVYAKYINEYGEESSETTYKVTNIDEIAPIINLTADLITLQEEISVQVQVTDNMKVDIVKWAEGAQGESYFTDNGTEILNDSTITLTIKNNGIYTIYAVDTVGNKQTYTLTVTNIVEIPPIAVISMSPVNNIYTVTNIVWNYSLSTDPTGGFIVGSEWQLDSNAITTSPPNGTISVGGNHVMKMRVKNNKNVWSDWTQTSFNVNNNIVMTFNYTGAVQTWNVPSTISKIKIECYGAEGGRGYSYLGGKGGYVRGDKILAGGTLIYIYAGGKGGDYKLGANTNPASNYLWVIGGFNGGGSSMACQASYYTGGAGGGASDIRIGGTSLNNRVIVAGGGGGASSSGTSGAGGGLTGLNASDATYGGKGGTQVAGGAGGAIYLASRPGTRGIEGSLGSGGDGGTLGNGTYSYAGAGGGGGYYGGGGGSIGTSAGGGSSYYGTLSSPTTSSNYWSGNGKVVITLLQ